MTNSAPAHGLWSPVVINLRMHRDMAVPPSGNPDAAFAQTMIAHHQGAIDIARVISVSTAIPRATSWRGR